MRKYTVTVKERIDEFSAFFGVCRIDKSIVPDFVESNEDGSEVTYSFETEHDVERALDLSDGVISYTVESKCASCGRVGEFEEDWYEVDDGDLCPECPKMLNYDERLDA